MADMLGLPLPKYTNVAKLQKTPILPFHFVSSWLGTLLPHPLLPTHRQREGLAVPEGPGLSPRSGALWGHPRSGIPGRASRARAGAPSIVRAAEGLARIAPLGEGNALFLASVTQERSQNQQFLGSVEMRGR